MPDNDYYPGVKNALWLLEDARTRTEQVIETTDNQESRDWLLDKHDTWDNSISGIAMGYYVEAEKGLKHLKKKNAAGKKSEKIGQKTINKNRADITTTTKKYSASGASQGKVIQLKHTICDSPSAVNSAIKDAFTQLSGKNDEVPLEDDILIAEIFIANPNNAWPLDRTFTSGKDWVIHQHKFSISAFETAVKEKLTDHLLSKNFNSSYAIAKKKKDLQKIYIEEEREKQRGKRSRPLKDLYPSGGIQQTTDKFDLENDDPEIEQEIQPTKKLFIASNNTQNTTTTPTHEDTSSLASKKHPFGDIAGLIPFPSLVLKLNFTTGRKIQFSETEPAEKINKIVLSIRWTDDDVLSVKFIRRKLLDLASDQNLFADIEELT